MHRISSVRWIAAHALLSLAVAPGVVFAQRDSGELLQRANAAYAAGDFETCDELYSAIVEIGTESRLVPFNAACCRALSGDDEGAFEMLFLSADAGYKDWRHLERDPDLESLRTQPKWIEVLTRVHAVEDAYLAAVNPELYEMYLQDQADRAPGDIDWEVVSVRDHDRQARVLELIEEDALSASDDYLHAAMILQHGSESWHYENARDLARKAVELDPTNATAKWLSAAAHDRYLHSIGEPQVYGTQYRRDPNGGPWTLDPIDADAVSDEERAELGVPPIADSRKRVDTMNSN